MATEKPPRVQTKMIGTRLPLDVAELVDKEAHRVGLTQAEFVRAAILRQLGPHRLTVTEAGKYQRPATRAAQREASKQLTRRL